MNTSRTGLRQCRRPLCTIEIGTGEKDREIEGVADYGPVVLQRRIGVLETMETKYKIEVGTRKLEGKA
jgi:hypothetical protein